MQLPHDLQVRVCPEMLELAYKLWKQSRTEDCPAEDSSNSARTRGTSYRLSRCYLRDYDLVALCSEGASLTLSRQTVIW